MPLSPPNKFELNYLYYLQNEPLKNNQRVQYLSRLSIKEIFEKIYFRAEKFSSMKPFIYSELLNIDCEEFYNKFDETITIYAQ